MLFHDRAPLENVRRLADGRIAATARFARSGVYSYAGHELGRPDLPTVAVYRPEAEVFDERAMASFAHKAITVGHPPTGVTVDNWKQHAAGWTEGKVARDGEFVVIPLMLADASAVRAYDSGEARELSAGYTSSLVWGSGTTPDGQRFDATMTKIFGDHIALVAKGRAGSECRIGDNMNAVTVPPICDAERRMIEAQARANHRTKTAYLGDRAPAFTDAMAAEAVVNALRQREQAAAFADQYAADTAVQIARDETALAMAADAHNAWRR